MRKHPGIADQGITRVTCILYWNGSLSSSYAFLSSFLSMYLGGCGPSIWIPAFHVQERDGIFGSWPQPGADLLLQPYGLWPVDHRSLPCLLSCNSAFQVSNFKISKGIVWENKNATRIFKCQRKKPLNFICLLQKLSH